MLHEFVDLIDLKVLPKRMKYLQWYLVGLVDGEGCFSISIKQQQTTRFGIVVDPVFHVVQHKDHKVVLEILKRVLHCGRLEVKHGQDNLMQFVVDNRKQLIEKVIPFFKKHKLIVKSDDFLKFAEIVQMLEQKKHFTRDGLIDLVKKSYQLSDKRKLTLSQTIEIINRGSPQRPYAE